MRGLWLRVWRLLRWRASERDIEEELRFHVDMEAEQYRRGGAGGVEARRRALIAFGGEARWREGVRATRGTAWIEDGLRDVRLAARGLRRAPGFAAAAIGTIALGVGATTAIYSVVDQVVLSPLPYADGDELVTVWMHNATRGIDEGMTSWPNFADWREATTTLGAMAAVVPDRLTLAGDGQPEEVASAAVSRGFFELIGDPLEIGRTFRDDESEVAFANVVVLSHGLFTRRFGADPSVLGRLIELDGAMFEVIGVAKRGRAYPRDAELWTPLAFGPNREGMFPRGRLWFPVIGRLSDGVDLSAAQQEMNGIAARLETEYPDVNRGVGITLEPLRTTILGDARTPLLVLLAAVALVMAIAVVNVANLLLARGTVRARELAARLALGAGGGRMVRQMLAHSLVLGAAGGTLGAALAAAGVSALVAAAPPDLPRVDEVTVDLVILGLALSTALGASVLFGSLPALHATRIAPAAVLGSATRASSARALTRLRAVFVGGQFALAFVLLIGSGLLLRSFLNLRAVDPGFDVEGVLSVGISLPDGRYTDRDARREFHRGLLDALTVLPGVEGVGAISSLFVSDVPPTGIVTIESLPDQFESGAEIPVISDIVSTGFFSAAGMRIVAGRAFRETDGPDDPPAAIVNEAFARVYLEGLDPVGERFTWGRPYGEATKWFTIVGVAVDARRSGLDAPVRPTVFQALAQSPPGAVEVLARTTDGPRLLLPAVRAVIGGRDSDVVVSNERTLEEAMADSLAQRRFVTWVIALFAATALALAGVGVFGVMAYVVGSRTRDIGIRVALGAARPRVLGEVMRAGMLQAGSGLLLGTLVWLGVARIVGSQLFGLQPTDPKTLASAAAALLLVAALACLVPARRASAVEAMVALRHE